MEYPLVSGRSGHFPQDGKCPLCGRRSVLEPNRFVALLGGGLLMDRKNDSGGPSDLIDGFLDLAWHEAHGPDLDEHEAGCVLPIAQEVRGGQSGIFCCSVAFLRGLVNQMLDKSEEMMQDTRKGDPAP